MLRRRSRALRPPPTPLHVDARKVIVVGTSLWILAAVVTGCAWSWLGTHDHRIWFWTSLTGALLGLLGLLLIRKHSGEGRV